MTAATDISGKFALDVQAVNGLRVAARKTGQAGLEAAARQFEALFLNMMLKSMREATPKDSLMDSEQSRLYISMLDQQLSQSMAARGVGLAEVMMRQLRGNLPPETAATDALVSDRLQRAEVRAAEASALAAPQPGAPAPLVPLASPVPGTPFGQQAGGTLSGQALPAEQAPEQVREHGTAGSAGISTRPPTHPAITDATIPCDSVSATIAAICKRGQPGNRHSRAVHVGAGSA